MSAVDEWAPALVTLPRIALLAAALALLAVALLVFPRRKARARLIAASRRVNERGSARAVFGTGGAAMAQHLPESSMPQVLAAAGPAPPQPPSPSTEPYSPVKVADIPDGEHHVTFADGSVYSGQWRGGRMHGRGVFKWTNGDRFEGEWKKGQEDGQGNFAAADGSMYFGRWQGGKMDGQGVYKPAGQALPESAAGAPPKAPAKVIYFREYVGGRLVKESALRVDKKDLLRRKQMKKDEEGKRAQAYRPLQPGEVIYKGHHSYDLMRQLQLGILYSIAQAAALDGSRTALSRLDFTAESVQYFPSGSSDTPAFKWKDYAPRVFAALRLAFGIDPADYLVSLTGGPALRELPSPGASGALFFLSDDDRFFVKSVRREEMGLVLSLMPKYYAHVMAHPGTLLVGFCGVHRVSPWLGRNARFLVMGNVLPTDRRMHRKFDLKGSTYKRTVGTERRKADSGATLKDLDLDLRFELTPERYRRVLLQLHQDVALLEVMHVIDYSLLLGVHFRRWGDAQWFPPFTDWPKPTPSPFESSIRRSLQGENGGLPSIGEAETVGGGDTAEADAAVEEMAAGEGGGGLGENAARAPQRQGSFNLGRSLVESLHAMSTAGVDSTLSRSAASVVERATSVRQAARVSAAAAASALSAVSTPRVPLAMHHTLPGIHLDVPAPVAAPPTPPPAAASGAADSPPRSPTRSARQERRRARAMRRSDVESGCGWAVPATALRATSDGAVAREPVLLYISVIDFLQHYRLIKRVEHAWKAALHGETVSVSPPGFYAKRFLALIENVFVLAAEAR